MHKKGPEVYILLYNVISFFIGFTTTTMWLMYNQQKSNFSGPENQNKITTR